jgi:hypothetical protein
MKLKEKLAHDYAGDYGNRYLAYLEGFDKALMLATEDLRRSEQSVDGPLEQIYKLLTKLGDDET